MQRSARFLALGCVAATIGVAHAAGTVNVSFVAPERFADVGTAPHERDENLDKLSRHLQSLGQKYLAADQSLTIEVLDVDLAGHMKPLRRGGEVRLVRSGADRPRITLRYALEAGGQSAQRGEESIADLNFLGRIPHYAASDTLRYEKRMLEDWFKERIVERRPARR
jgi:hypothetical protein